MFFANGDYVPSVASKQVISEGFASQITNGNMSIAPQATTKVIVTNKAERTNYVTTVTCNNTTSKGNCNLTKKVLKKKIPGGKLSLYEVKEKAISLP